MYEELKNSFFFKDHELMIQVQSVREKDNHIKDLNERILKMSAES